MKRALSKARLDQMHNVLSGYVERKEVPGLVALVHLSDLLCRMRGLGYGYYERQKVDLVDDPAWAMLMKEHRDLDGVDLARFTFELDEAVGGIYKLVSMICGTPAAKAAGN